ncbi:hypothetical protein MOQ_003727 [Trypanosoma cruzi marinkellei]|uniref:SEC7 domain-containing protein n=1 Tax=Trypanosoma cruzi marinkellei TaxID=85056 RepID=K2MB90_TRYCR|nr:hypothetical protein MOQ_003727 [Trypanosoma cruzi marinkellei]
MSKSVLQVIARIASLCKGRHAYLREVCLYTQGALEQTGGAGAAVNLLFYPLLIASYVSNEEQMFLPLALEGILCLLRLHIVSEYTMYGPPEVPLPEKKRKGLFATTDVTAPGEGLSLNSALATKTTPLTDVILDTVKRHRHSVLEGVSFLVLQCLTELMLYCEWIKGPKLVDCFQSAFEAQLEVRPMSGSGISNSLLPHVLSRILAGRRGANSVDPKTPSMDTTVECNEKQPTLDKCNSLVNSMDITIVAPLTDIVANRQQSTGEEEDEDDQEEKQQLTLSNHQDCYALLVRICDLSIKVVESRTPADSMEWRRKRLSSRLLAHFINAVNDDFARSDFFRSALHEKITLSLLHNCALEDPVLHGVALKTLYQVVMRYRNILKSKVVIFILGLLLPIVNSKNTSYEQKATILTFFEHTLRDPQLLMDWFTNFDCVQGMPNLCEQLVSGLSKMSKMSHVSSWVSAKQDALLRLKCIKALGTFVRSLEGIAKEFPMGGGITPHSQERELEPRENQEINSVAAENEKGETGAHSRNNINSGSLSECGVEQLLRGKKAFDAVVDKFNSGDHAAAIAMALNVHLLSSAAPEAVARFLLQKELDPVGVGEYLGKDNEERKAVLRAFIGLNDFSGLPIDDAMRLFLGKFKLPGEAQVVDRAMELFAREYCAQNPSSFSGPGPAFILAFSIMLLNTDAHSSHVRDKMTLEQFVRNNSGIDDGKDLSRSLLEGVYQRITAREILLEARGAVPSNGLRKWSYGKKDMRPLSSSSSLSSSGVRRRNPRFSRQMEQAYLLETSVEQITRDVSSEPYTSINSSELVGALMESTWTALLAAFSIPMEEMENIELIDTSLEGIESAIKVCCKFSCRTQRKAFISALLTFTHLTNFREIEYKSLKSIIALTRVALEEGDHLETSWYEVLRCISLLSKLHILAESPWTSVLNDRNGNHAALKAPNTFAEGQGRASSQPQWERAKLERQNAEIIAKYIDEVEVHRLFSRSNYLKDAAVVSLVEALCLVSAEELAEIPPRIFSLQKLVEVTDTNIGRLRYVWSKMWTNVSRHFVKVALSSNELEPMYVVDHLRQLATKFLAREELGDFNFQKGVLQPFEAIASRTQSTKLKELLVASLGQMVEAQAQNLRSGWGTVIEALAHCMQHETNPDVVSSSAIVLQNITLCHLYLLTTSGLVKIVRAWAVVARSAFSDDLAHSAVWFVRYVTVALALHADSNNSCEGVQHSCASQCGKSSNGEKEKEIHVDESHSHAIKENNKSHSLLLKEEIKALASCAAFPVDGDENDKVERGRVRTTEDMPLFPVAVGTLASLLAHRSISGEAMEAMLFVMTDHRAALTPTEWWYTVGSGVAPALDFLLQQCRFSNEVERDVWLSLFKRAVTNVVQFVGYNLDGDPLPVDHVLFLFRVFVGRACCGSHDEATEIGLQGARQMLDIFKEHDVVDEVLWNDMVAYIQEIGDMFLGALESILRHPMDPTQQDTLTPTLLAFLQYVKWNRDAALTPQLTTLCRTKAVKVLLGILQRFMCLMRTSVSFRDSFTEKRDVFDLALFISLERSLCNAILDVERRYGEFLENEINTLWMLIIGQFIAVTERNSNVCREEASSLKGIIRELLDSMFEAPQRIMVARCRICMPFLCQLIALSDDVFAESLANLFLRYHTASVQNI